MSTIKYRDTICDKDHTGDVPESVLTALPENQGYPVRHRCAACAYQEGTREGAEVRDGLLERINELTSENATLRDELRQLRAQRK